MTVTVVVPPEVGRGIAGVTHCGKYINASERCRRKPHEGECRPGDASWLLNADGFPHKAAANEQTGCWEWVGTIDRDGYGRIKRKGQNHPAHRAVYEALIGPIPDGMQLDHLCRVRRCVNPDHLDPKTHIDNVMAPGSQSLAAVNAAKTHCPNGHPYTDENTYLYPSGRSCRTCRKDRP